LFTSEKDQISNDAPSFEFTKNSYSIPASVWVKVDNFTNKNITVNTCNDIIINNFWNNIKFDDNFCEDIEILSWESKIIDYSTEYKNFFSTWKYTMKVLFNWNEYIDQVEIKNKWTLWKIFVWLFYAPIYNLLVFLLWVFSGSFWLAILSITIIIRLVLLYPQHKMMVSQRKLQAIQPKIKEIQEQYKSDKQLLWQKLLELYKKENVNPMGSCWFLLIQMPILLVIYHIILWIKDPSNHYYVYNFLTTFNFESINYDFLWLNLVESWWVWWVILAVIVASLQFFQIKLSLNKNKKDNNKWVVLEKKKGKDSYSQMMPDPEVMNKFMLYWLPWMIFVFTYTLFAWVWIYLWISTLFMLFQQLIVNKKIKK
jgi:YidC/Oxa1 family membrane protein insertase